MLPTEALPNLVRFVGVLFFAVATASASTEDPTQTLFVIQRSKNANEIHYDARVLGNGQLDEKNPIDSYWLQKAEDGSRRPISQIQKIAYGYNVGAPVDGRYPLTLKAFSGMAMSMVKIGDKWRVQTTIAGQQAYLQRLFVTTDESGVMPKVVSIDWYGEGAEGKPVHERVEK